MDNQSWDKAKLADWKRMWESDMGKEALNKMKQLKDLCLDSALKESNSDAINFYVGRAAGIDLVMIDIQTGIEAAEEAANKEKEGAGKQK